MFNSTTFSSAFLADIVWAAITITGVLIYTNAQRRKAKKTQQVVAPIFPAQRPYRIVITEKQFKSLVEGKETYNGPDRMILEEIGFEKMGEIITQAWADNALKK